MSMNKVPKNIQIAIDFTETFKEYEHSHIAIREAMCLKAQFPAVLLPIEGTDLFAGKVQYAPVGLHISTSPPKAGYYCENGVLTAELDKNCDSEAYRNLLLELIDFWKDRTTYTAVKQLDPSGRNEFIHAFINDENVTPLTVKSASYSFRTAGIQLDNGKLLLLGIPGLKVEIHENMKRLEKMGADTGYLEGMLICMDLLAEVCGFYAKQAIEASKLAEGFRRDELLRMSEVLEKITLSKPETLREAIQLVWLYNLLAGTDNFGRMDVYLGDFYVRDIESGRLSKETADKLIEGFWRFFDACINPWSGRIIIGGMGRRNETSADQFALAAIEATRKVRGLLPQLSLRLYKGSNKDLLNKAMEAIAEGCISPMLYNDDVMIESIMKTFGVNREEAMQYVPSDCGEYGIEYKTIGFPDGTFNLAKVLEITLRNGIEPTTGLQQGLKTGELNSFSGFDAFFDAFKLQIEHVVNHLCPRIVPFYEGLKSTVPFLFCSMLYADCIEKGVGLIAGARYIGLNIEVYGNITVADSLTAIKKLVFDEKKISPDELIKALDADFVGYERIQRMLLSAPKYGNDEDAADDMAVLFQASLCKIIQSQKEELKLDFLLADLINAGGHISLGKYVGATPDGRLALMPLTNANNPTLGADKQGLTALLNSMAKLNTWDIGGEVQYLKISRETLTNSKEKITDLFKAYFENGGPQLMVTSVAKGELERAMKEPEKYANLMVRVGGYNARFVELAIEDQREILGRTLI